MTAPATERSVTIDVMIEGTELIALCGHRWVPWRDPRKLPVCQPCVRVLSEILESS